MTSPSTDSAANSIEDSVYMYVQVLPVAVNEHGGTYTLVVQLANDATIDVGALGTLTFAAGWYAYVGSALGPGGFKRIERHRNVATGEHAVRHWHIDYLLGHPAASLDTARKMPGVDGECRVASELASAAVPEFGCSDCGCESHLFVRSSRESLLTAVERAHDAVETR